MRALRWTLVVKIKGTMIRVERHRALCRVELRGLSDLRTTVERMDSSYYQRQADQERRRLEKHLSDQARADREISKEETAADRDSRDAANTKSESNARSKRSSEQRHRTAAAKAREARAKASDAASKAQVKINGFERQARGADEADRRKQAQQQKQGEQAAQRAREADRRAREQVARRVAAESLAQSREVTSLRTRTDELEDQLQRARLAAPSEICVLFISGTIEGGVAPLHLDREIREVQQKLASSTHREHIRFELLHATQIRDIIDGLNRFRPDVVHFSGHGDRSVLMFEGSDGRPHEFRDEQLALLLQVSPKPIRLLVLNACESAEMAVLATDYLDSEIGMETPIGDDTAKTFAGQLYGSLAEGLSLAVAFNQAKVQANILNDDSGRPRLSTAAGIDAEHVVLVSP